MGLVYRALKKGTPHPHGFGWFGPLAEFQVSAEREMSKYNHLSKAEFERTFRREGKPLRLDAVVVMWGDEPESNELGEVSP